MRNYLRGPMQVPGVLFLYEDILRSDATTITEHIQAFPTYSRYPWYLWNVTLGFPPFLNDVEFAAIVFHYSLRPTFHWLKPEWRNYLASHPAMVRVAIFQDEVWYFQEREQFLRDCRIDCLYSRHKPHHVRDIYPADLPVKKYVHYLAGYVADDLIVRSAQHGRPWAERGVDVGYRGRQLPYYFGAGSQEKGTIGHEFQARTAQEGFTYDIASEEGQRLYGVRWDAFLGNCRAMLGVEGGVSVIDSSGHFRREYQRLLAQNPQLTFADYVAAMGEPFQQLENRIDYRSLTPRHFESAAFRNLQILFEGNYDGLLQPYRHYVPLKKDYSNLAEVVAILRDPDRATMITDAAYQDLIASGAYSYQCFLRSFDRVLRELCPVLDRPLISARDATLRACFAAYATFPTRQYLLQQLAASRSQDATRPGQADAYSRVTDDITRYQKVRSRYATRRPLLLRLRARWEEYFWRRAERRLQHPIPTATRPQRGVPFVDTIVGLAYEGWLFASKAWHKLRRYAR